MGLKAIISTSMESIILIKDNCPIIIDKACHADTCKAQSELYWTANRT